MTAFDGPGLSSGPAALDSPVAIRIEPDALAERLARSHTIVQTYEHDLWHQQRIAPGQKMKHAAVLVPLVERSGGTQVLLTQRTSHLHDHAGQISFPGGRVEPEDRHREDTALRETEEEIGLPRTAIRVLGALSTLWIALSNFVVHPFVGVTDVRPEFRLRANEVSALLEVPVRHLRDRGGACALRRAIGRNRANALWRPRRQGLRPRTTRSVALADGTGLGLGHST